MNDGDDVEPQRLNGQNGGYYDDDDDDDGDGGDDGDDSDDGISMAMAMMMMLKLTEHKARLNRWKNPVMDIHSHNHWPQIKPQATTPRPLHDDGDEEKDDDDGNEDENEDRDDEDEDNNTEENDKEDNDDAKLPCLHVTCYNRKDDSLQASGR